MVISRVNRFFRILTVCCRFGLDQWLGQAVLLPGLLGKLSLKRQFDAPLRVRTRLALEALGPIFIKFGQMISTRRDLIDVELAAELAKLQDRVPPFDGETTEKLIELAYGRSASVVFESFDNQAVASASIAQVHKATLPGGQPVAVKILRPNMAAMIADDIALLETIAGVVERLWPDGRRIRAREVVGEFAKLLKNEQNLLREAGNASLLRRNFSDETDLLVPEVYWDYCREKVMVMGWMTGLPILPAKSLAEAGIDIPKLAEKGVKIFFKQIFTDGFFHADMHPGNILVTTDGRYVALDFGIMGTLTDENRRYLAENCIGFFQRDYHRIALAHVEAGWAPPDTPIDEFEAAVRTVCEQIFDRPLSQISFSAFLLQLFQLSRDFDVAVQPQLVLLQKTLFQIEGLGRQLDPSLDLWKTAKPYVERWMSEQVGWRSWWNTFKREAPHWGSCLPQLPRLLHQVLQTQAQQDRQNHRLEEIKCRRQLCLTRWLTVGLVTALAVSLWFVWR